MGFSGIIAIVDSRVVPYMIVNFTTALAMAIILSTGMYMLVEAPGRRFFRAMADRLLGIQSQTAAVAG
jgi:peptidoglycan/LPS O-acetylase OafA/YrhL